MRYVEFRTLLEYDRSKTAQAMGTKLLQAAQQDQIFWRRIQELEPEQQTGAVLERLEGMDPTGNKKYVQWLAKQYIAQQFRLEDAPRVQQILTYFTERDVIRDFRRRGLGIDINQYTYQKLKTEVVASAEGGIEKDTQAPSDQLGYENLKDMNVLYSGNLGQLIVPKTEAASCELGKNTDWCTAASTSNQFDNYTKDGPLYVWIEPNGEKYQFHFESTQFMDKDDYKIDSKKMKYFRETNPITRRLFQTREKNMLTSNDAESADRAINYARDVIRGRWPEAEPLIAKYSRAASDYARDVIRGRWPQTEPVIAREADSAYFYAKDVIGGRWPEGEPAIAKDANSAYYYAKYVINGRWPEAEPVIASDARSAYEYAQGVIGGRWPEAEPVIAKDANSAYEYAQDVIGGRWPEGEPAIAKEETRAYEYAKYVIRGRWPEAEPAIARDADSAYSYARYIIRGRWPEGEPAIANDSLAKKEYQDFINSL